MKDRWINTGFDEEELKPYTEPELDITDQKRIGQFCSGDNLTRHHGSYFYVFIAVGFLTGFFSQRSGPCCPAVRKVHTHHKQQSLTLFINLYS